MKYQYSPHSPFSLTKPLFPFPPETESFRLSASNQSETHHYNLSSNSSENMEADQQGVMMMMRKAEIDTSAPFRSVKEAVMLFGERVLAGEVYSSKLREIQDETSENENDLAATERIGTITAELEETRQSLLKAREESMIMANSLSFLHEELQRTKRELEEIKEGKSEKQVKELMEIEDLKFVEDSREFEVKTETIHEKVEFQKKRYVTFADPPSFSQVLAPTTDAVLQRHPSLRKSKRKPLIPLIKGIFRKRGSSEVAFA